MHPEQYYEPHHCERMGMLPFAWQALDFQYTLKINGIKMRKWCTFIIDGQVQSKPTLQKQGHHLVSKMQSVNYLPMRSLHLHAFWLNPFKANVYDVLSDAGAL